MGVEYIPNTSETRYQHQKLARLNMITRLEADILMDMQICDIEGWDRMEYINMLKGLINSLGKADTPQTDCEKCAEYGSFKCTKCDGEMYYKPQTDCSWK